MAASTLSRLLSGLFLGAVLVLSGGMEAKATDLVTVPGNPLNINVGTDNSYQVFHQNIPGVGQAFPNGQSLADFGWIIHTPTGFYNPNFAGRISATGGFGTPVTELAQSAVTGSGTQADPYVVTTETQLGTTGLMAYTKVTYVDGEEYLGQTLALTNTSDVDQEVSVFLGSDIYLAGSDSGIPMVVNASNSPGGYDCNSGGYNILLVPQTPVDAYVAAHFRTVWTQIRGGQLTSSVIGASCTDNGAALQWNRVIAAGATATISAATSFGPIPVIAEFNVYDVAPPEGYVRTSVDVQINGVGFLPETTFDFGAGITVANLVIVDENTATATLRIAGNATIGMRDVVATRDAASGRVVTLRDGFEVKKREGGGGSPFATTLITTGAALVDGDAVVWGFRGSAQQGNGAMVVASNAAPAKVALLGNVTQLTGGAYHLLALDDNGDVYGWGQSGYGETGCTGFYVSTPCKVIGNITQIAAGEYFSVALSDAGEVYTWGHNLYGQLGNGTTGNRNTPVKVDLNGETARLIGGAYEGAFAVTQEGHVWAWGDNEASGLGFQGPNYGVQRIVRTPTRVPNLDEYASRIVYIAGGNGWGEALLEDGVLIGWGLRASLGVGVRSTAYSSPEVVEILDGVSSVFARYVGSFVLTTDGQLFTWGQTGGSAFPMVYGDAPTFRANTHGRVTAIGGGKEHLFYQTEDGKLYGVGYNDLYKLDQSTCCAPNIVWPGKEIRF